MKFRVRRLLNHRGALLAAVIAIFALPSNVSAQGEDPGVAHARLHGLFDRGKRNHLDRALADARNNGAEAVVFDLDVRGGSVADAQLAVGSILDSPVPVYVFVNSAAWGAGALVALAADSAFMAPGATLGWGDVDEADNELAPTALRELRSEFRVLALRNGLDDQIAMAMVDPDIAIDGFVGAGERLTLAAAEATQLGYAVEQVDDVAQLLESIGLEGAEPSTYSPVQIASGITVTVSNNNWRDVRINLQFGVSGGIRQGLGQVTSMNTVEFEIPLDMVTAGSRVRAVAEVIGSSERAVTDWITAQPGLAIDWVIANVISQSNYFVYIRY